MNELKNCYIIDKLENIGAYAKLSANFKTAVDFLAKGDFAALKSGKNEIDGDEVFVNNAAPEYVLPADRKGELHHAYFDIHVPLTADEKIGLAIYDARVKAPFDEAGDCGFSDQPLDWQVIHKGEFCITWPVTCVHAPAVTTDSPKPAKKLIVKVKV